MTDDGFSDAQVARTGPDWREQIAALQARLDELRPQLIEFETQLADRLAAINAFEFRVRTKLGSLAQRLDDIQMQIDDLRRELRRRRRGWFDEPDAAGPTADHGRWRFAEEDAAAASGEYRYRSKSGDPPRQPLEAAQLAKLKQMYRRLARRFHPDLALDEVDRAYRTDLMMSINTAYTAGDLERLERLALEPDSVSRAPQTDQALAEALAREVERCRRRLQEIEQELDTLEHHDSTRLMRRTERAAAAGRDLLDELARDLRRRISEKMVERDVLESQVEEAGEEDADFDEDELADVVYDLGLEEADVEDPFDQFDNWRPRQQRRWDKDQYEREQDDALGDYE